MFVAWLWVKEAVVGLFRNLWWTMMAIFLSVSCFLFFSISYIAGMNAEHLAEVLDSKIEIKMDLYDHATEYGDIEQEIRALDGVGSVTFISKEEAYEKVEKDMGENADILSVLETNPFPARFVVKVTDPRFIEGVVKEVSTWEVAETIQYGEEYVEKMLMLSQLIRNAGYAVTALAAVFSVFVLISTIRVNIVQRRNEIRVKQLVGASSVTIRAPFVLEAVFLTGISSIVVYYLFFYGYARLVELVKGIIPYAPILDAPVVLEAIFLPLSLLAVGIALIGSTFSVKQFLKKA